MLLTILSEFRGLHSQTAKDRGAIKDGPASSETSGTIYGFDGFGILGLIRANKVRTILKSFILGYSSIWVTELGGIRDAKPFADRTSGRKASIKTDMCSLKISWTGGVRQLGRSLEHLCLNC
jgi:hypothetical protein